MFSDRKPASAIRGSSPMIQFVFFEKVQCSRVSIICSVKWSSFSTTPGIRSVAVTTVTVSILRKFFHRSEMPAPARLGLRIDSQIVVERAEPVG